MNTMTLHWFQTQRMGLFISMLNLYNMEHNLSFPDDSKTMILSCWSVGIFLPSQWLKWIGAYFPYLKDSIDLHEKWQWLSSLKISVVMFQGSTFTFFTRSWDVILTPSTVVTFKAQKRKEDISSTCTSCIGDEKPF